MTSEQTSNLSQKLAKFCSNMSELESMTSQFSNFYSELMDQPDNQSNVWTKLDANVTCSFVNASYFWLYLSLKGTELQDHPIKDEIVRVRKYMQDYMVLKKDAPKLNVKTAEKFIKNALWDPTRNEASQSNKQNEQQTTCSYNPNNRQGNTNSRQYNANQRQHNTNYRQHNPRGGRPFKKRRH